MGRLSIADRIDIVFNAPRRVAVSCIFVLLWASFVAVVAPGECRAQTEIGTSAWHEAPHSRIRLLSATGLYYQGKPVLAAAIEILLDEGWKTYWRSPGEGLPPSLDWRGSGNLSGTTVLWPAPSRISGGNGASYAGYERQLLLPVLVVARDKSLPINLNLAISYGICSDICIPVETVLQLEIPPPPHEAQQDRIRAALDRVPKTQDQGVYCPHSFIAARRHSVNGRPALVIKTAFEDNATGLELFVEAPEGHALRTPFLQPAASRGRSHYVMFFDTEAAIDGLLGRTLILTMVSDQGSCESTWRVK